MDLYADQILDHARHPRHTGTLPDATVRHEEANLSCGDRVHLELCVEDDLISRLGWTGSGCAISQAGMSLLAEHIIGKSAAMILVLTKGDALALLGVPMSERRMKCALLGLHTVQNALRLQQSLPLQSWTETVA